MKGRFWRKALAASLALLIVTGSVPIKPISNVFESMVVTAEAVEEVTKTFSLSNATRSEDRMSFLMNDPDDNNSQKTVIFPDCDSNCVITYNSSGGYKEIRNRTGANGILATNIPIHITPYINGKVTKVEFTKMGRYAANYYPDGETLTEGTFSMSIDGMKYNGTESALTGNGLKDGYTLTEKDSFSFISTNAEGIEGDIVIQLGVASRLILWNNCEIKITYLPAAEPAHEHSFSYSKNNEGNILTATCAHNDGRACSLENSNYQVSLTLNPPADVYYQFGYTYPAKLEGTALFKKETGATVGDITYKNNTTGENLGTQYPTSSGEHPTGAGDYTASVTINVGGTTYTLSKDFTLSNLFTINNSYPQFSVGTEQYSVTNRAAENETVTLTFTPQYGETLKSLSVKGETTNYSLENGITKVDATHYTFLMPAEEVNISEATFGIDENDFVQDGDTYTIKNADGWNYFCLLTNYDTTLDGFNGKTVKLDKDIEVSAMAGMSAHPFKGTFDGQGKTLTFNLTASEGYSAPFHYTDGATISNLHVTGLIEGGDISPLAGLVGKATGNITIENCHVSTQISTTVSISAWHGGIIAFWDDSNVECTITGCVYDGLIYNPNEANVTSYCFGFIGNSYGSNMNATFTDCLFAPAEYTDGKKALREDYGSHTFVYPKSGLIFDVTNCYYTRNLGNRQGRPAATAITAPANLGAETTDHGIVKGYQNGLLFNGNYYTPKYGDAVVEYPFDDDEERASVTFNGDGYNLVGVNITENVEKVSSVTYNRTFTPGATTTVILPFNYDCNGNEGGKFYNFKDVTYDEDKHEWVCKIIAPGEAGSNNVTSLTANTPYLFVPTATKMTFPNIESMTGGVVTLLPTTLNEYGGATTDYNWNFYGTYTGKNWTEASKDYGFAAQSGTAVHGEGVVAGQFVRYAPGASIGPMRCYLRYAGNGALEDTYTVANPDEGDPVRNVPLWDYPDNVSAADTYKQISFSAGEGSGTKDVIYIPENRSYILPECNFTAPDGKAFKGWSVKIGDAEAVSKQPGDAIEVTADTTITAEFEAMNIINSANITLGGELGLNFYLTIPDDVVTAGAKVVMNGPEGEKEVALSSLSKDDKGRYKVTYKIKAVYINENVSLNVTDSDGNTLDLFKASGSQVDNNTLVYSIYDYVQSAKADTSLTEKERNMVDTMYTYGAYSAKWFNDTDLPNDVNELNDLNMSDYEKYKLQTNGSSDSITLTGLSLILDSNTALRLYFTSADDISGHSAKIDDVDLTIHPTETAGKYYVEIDDISANNLISNYSIVFDGTYTATVSTMTYVYNSLKNGTTDDVMNVLKALCAYSDAVNKS